MMTKMPKWVLVLIVALFLGVLLIHPVTRPIIVWLLPLGSGWDDLVAMIAFGIAAAILYFGSWTSLFAWLRNRNKYDNDAAKPFFRIVAIVSGLLVLGLLFPFTRPIVLFILPLGSGLDDLVFFIALGVFVFFSFIWGWISIPQVLRRNKKG